MRIPAWIIVLTVPWLYYSILESSKHKASFGKVIFDLCVTDNSGGRISFWKASLRYWLKFLLFPVVPVIIYLSESLLRKPYILLLLIPSLTYLLPLINKTGRSLHDILSGTKVSVSGKNIYREGLDS